MSVVHEYYVRYLGCQSWIRVDKVKYFNLRRRKNSKEFVSNGLVNHYLEIPSSWTDKYARQLKS